MSRPNGLELSYDLRSELSGIEFLSFTPSKLRNRAMTIEDFSISSVEGSRPSNINPERNSKPNETSDWETVTWVFSDILQSISVREKENLPVVLTKAQQLVDLLIKNPLLKHEIVIENVLSRIQFMFYDKKPLLRSMAYRIMRHTLAGRDTVAQLAQHKLFVNLTVSLSTKTPLIEKEEALKLIRAIVAIPECAGLLSIGVIKALVILTEHESDESASAPSISDSKFSKSSYVSSLRDTTSSLFCKVCVETICELLLVNAELVFQAGGMRLLINLILSGTPEISATCVLTFITLLDHPTARFFLRGGSDLDSLLSIFNLFDDDDTLPNGHDNGRLSKRAMDMTFLISVLMKSWTGLLFFCHDNLSGLNLLLMNLKKRNIKLQSIILDLLMDILRIKTLPWLETSKLGLFLKRFSSFMSTNYSESGPHFEYSKIAPRTTESNILAHHQGLLLKLLIDCDIKQLLLNIISDERDEENISKATYLLTHVFEMAVNYLPAEFYEKSLLGISGHPISANSIHRIQFATNTHMPPMTLAKKQSIKSSVKDITQSHRLNLTDSMFKSLLTNVKTLHLKEFIDWDWTSLSQLFQGPIRNPQRFAEIQEKYPKLLKTFISFLRPFKYRFGQIPLLPSTKYPALKNPKVVILVASQLFESLLTFNEGAQFLASNKLMPQLAEIFAQVDPFSGITSNDPILSENRLKSTLCIGYIKFIGVFSNSERGIRVLEQWQILHLINDIVEGSAVSETNNHLLFNILNNLNYLIDTPTRLILSRALATCNDKVKVFVLDNVIPNLISKNVNGKFLIDLLAETIYDLNELISDSAIRHLHDFFSSDENSGKIGLLIDAQPSVAILSRTEEGKSLLYKFCGTSQGFKFLNRAGFVETSLKECIKQLQSFTYLNMMESSIRLLFYPYLNLGSRQKPLRHFFHYLLSTEEGYSYFKHHQQFVDSILQTIRKLSVNLNLVEETIMPKMVRSPFASSMTLFSEYSLDNDSGRDYLDTFQDEESQTSRPKLRMLDLCSGERILKSDADIQALNFKKLKQSMWILGEIASAKYGFQLLDPSYSIFISEKHIAEVIVHIFKTASHWQFRGLAFYLLGMMSSTEEGIEILDELNWVSIKNSYVDEVSLAYPISLLDPEKLGLIDETDGDIGASCSSNDEGSRADRERTMIFKTFTEVEEDAAPENLRLVIENALNLINHLSSILGRIERKAREQLQKMKREVPQLFCNINFFVKVINLLEKGIFKYRVRLFIFGLFDCPSLLEEMVKRKRKSSIAKRTT